MTRETLWKTLTTEERIRRIYEELHDEEKVEVGADWEIEIGLSVRSLRTRVVPPTAKTHIPFSTKEARWIEAQLNANYEVAVERAQLKYFEEMASQEA